MTLMGAADTTVYVSQGEQAIGNRDTHVITTILGSCVAVCLIDARRRIGGMNHILVPDAGMSRITVLGAGATAMERLINALLKAGTGKADLAAKVFGGAAVVQGLSDIGEKNARFVFEYLENEGIPCISRSVGGVRARRLNFWPASGQVRQRFISAAEVPVEVPKTPVAANGLELL